MFALIRHAAYSIASGSLTSQGEAHARMLADRLRSANPNWKEVRTSQVSRTHETAAIVAQELSLPLEIDQRIGMDGNYVDLLPPTEPNGIILVSHLPILTQMLRAWSKEFNREEPPLTEESSGYLVDPATKTITGVKA